MLEKLQPARRLYRHVVIMPCSVTILREIFLQRNILTNILTYQPTCIMSALALLTIWEKQNEKMTFKILIVFILMVSRRIITKSWKSAEFFILHFWYLELCQIAMAENLTYQQSN